MVYLRKQAFVYVFLFSVGLLSVGCGSDNSLDEPSKEKLAELIKKEVKEARNIRRGPKAYYWNKCDKGSKLEGVNILKVGRDEERARYGVKADIVMRCERFAFNASELIARRVLYWYQENEVGEKDVQLNRFIRHRMEP